MYKSFKQFIVEETKEAFVTFGRFNPPTTGYAKLMDKIAAVAKGNKYFIYASQSSDPRKNPLSYENKIKFMRKMFPKHARSILIDKKVKTMIHAVTAIYDKGFRKITIVVGGDRVDEFKTLINKYNGVESRHGFYNFEDGIKVVSAGDRDPDSEGVVGMSASKMRAAAVKDDYASFSKGLPSNYKGGKELFNAVRMGMGLNESASALPKVKLTPVSDLREAYVKGDLYEEGQAVIVKSTNEAATIKKLCANYVIVETQLNPAKRVWLNNIETIE